MKRIGCIYKITNKNNNMIYIGQTCNSIEVRFRQHLIDTRSKRRLSFAFKKYGKESFSIEEIYVCFSKEEMNRSESEFILQYNSLHPHGYNYRVGDNRSFISDETRNKMSISAKLRKRKFGYKRSKETILNMSKANGGKPIVAVSIDTGKVTYFQYVNEAEQSGFNNSEIYRVLSKKRNHHKRHIFYTLEEFNQANQSGSSKIKIMEHAQRIEIEPTGKSTLNLYINELIELYNNGMSSLKLAKKYNVNKSTILRTLKKYKINTKSLSNRIKNLQETQTPIQ